MGFWEENEFVGMGLVFLENGKCVYIGRERFLMEIEMNVYEIVNKILLELRKVRYWLYLGLGFGFTLN
jgi:hypothetical protein